MAENKMRDGIIKRGKTWTYMVRERDPETGTTKQRWVGGFRTREEAKEARDKARNNVRRGTYAAPSRVTVAEWLDRWLAAQVHLRPKTRDGYVQKIEDYIKPKLGTERLQALSAERLTAVWAELVESGGKNGKPLAVTTVAPCRMILRKACKDAQGAAGGRLLEVNPVDGSKVPKGGRKHNAISSWTPEEQAVFLASPVVLASRWRPVWALALATGMRRGELCGLRWQDVDFAEGIVRAERSCVQIGKEIITNDTTKTGTVRRIAIDRTTLGMLRELRKQQAAERLAMGGAWGNDEDLVFVWPDGSRVTPDYVTKRFIDEQEARRPEKQLRRQIEQLTARADAADEPKAEVLRARVAELEARVAALPEALPRLRLHDLRHTHATTLLRAGWPVHIVSKRLGHKEVSMTLDVYADVIPQDDSASAELYEKLVYGGAR